MHVDTARCLYRRVPEHSAITLGRLHSSIAAAGPLRQEKVRSATRCKFGTPRSGSRVDPPTDPEITSTPHRIAQRAECDGYSSITEASSSTLSSFLLSGAGLLAK